MNMTADPQLVGEVALEPDAEEDNASRAKAWLQTNSMAGALANVVDGPRDWLFPKGDELFRGIYTRAGTGFTAEVLAICSAVAGEGKTTVGVGLAVTLAQDFPERRLLCVQTGLQRPLPAGDLGI